MLLPELVNAFTPVCVTVYTRTNYSEVESVHDFTPDGFKIYLKCIFY